MQSSPTSPEAAPNFLEQHRWVVFLVPFLLYMLLGMVEPKPPPAQPNSKDPDSPWNQLEDAGANWLGITIRYRHYPIVYTVRLAVIIAVIFWVARGYRVFPFRISLTGVFVGIVGGLVWIGLCRLNLEDRMLKPLGIGWLLGLGERSAYNPMEMLNHNPAWMISFLVIRFAGLVAVVPLIEEFFLRGFVMRYVMQADWWTVPFGQVTRTAVVTSVVYGVASHPAEALAAVAWFSLVTWLMVRTRNIWDCVMAHAVTNLMLGIYVVVWNDWTLW